MVSTDGLVKSFADDNDFLDYNQAIAMELDGLDTVDKRIEMEDRLTKLFEQANKNIQEDSKVFEEERKQYQEVINKYIPIVESMTVENANEVMDLIKNIDNHILTSEKEIKDHFAKKIKELNLVWNKDKQQYEIAQEG